MYAYILPAGIFKGRRVEDVPSEGLRHYLAKYRPEGELLTAIHLELEVRSRDRFDWLKPSEN
jgi:uncharacterized protein (DUF3820 family)